MVTPLDAILSVHRAFRNDMRAIDDAAYRAAAGDGNLSPAVERLRFFSEVLKWHADGEEELVFPAMERVAPLVAKAYFLDHREFDTMTEGLAKIKAASDALIAARATAELTAVLRIHLDKEDVHSSGPHHQDSGEAKIRESTAGVSRKPSSDCKACGCSSKHLCGLTAWNT